MEYRSIYDSVDAIQYTGKNFKEVNEFCGDRLSWSSESEYWEDDTPPEDLIIIADFNITTPIIPNDYIIRLSSGNYMALPEIDFETFLKR